MRRVIGHGATRNTIGFRELTRHVSGYGTFWFVCEQESIQKMFRKAAHDNSEACPDSNCRTDLPNRALRMRFDP